MNFNNSFEYKVVDKRFTKKIEIGHKITHNG